MRSLFLAGVFGLALVGLAAAQSPLAQAPYGGPPAVHTGATLRFEPTRLVLDASRPRGEIRVTASEDVTVDLAFIDRVMTEQGAILDLAEARGQPGAEDAIARLRSAAPLLAPVAGRLHLRPGESAVIRVALAQAGGRPGTPPRTADGEHRTHLTVSPAAPASADPAEARKVTWRFALPVIVRGPEAGARAALAVSPSVADGLPPLPRDAVDIEIWRAGDHSLYGDLVVRDAKGQVLAAVEGLAVYPELDRRIVRVALPPERDGSRNGPLEAQFVDRDAHPGAVLARLAIPQGRQLVEASGGERRSR